jgi:hypothetical protein
MSRHLPSKQQEVTTIKEETIECTPELLANTITSCLATAMLIAVFVSFCIIASAVFATAQALDAIVNARDEGLLVQL